MSTPGPGPDTNPDCLDTDRCPLVPGGHMDLLALVTIGVLVVAGFTAYWAVFNAKDDPIEHPGVGAVINSARIQIADKTHHE